MLTAGAYLKVNKTLNETYNIDIQQRLRGGGALAWLELTSDMVRLL